MLKKKLQREAATLSQVMLKNKDKVLPLKNKDKTLPIQTTETQKTNILILGTDEKDRYY